MAWFDCCEHKPIGTNTGGRMSANLGLILHHAVAYGSLYNFFNNPSAQVSAQFWVALDGRKEQYVDSEVVAWHGKSLNSRYCGVETEGCGAAFNYAEPMSDAMFNGLAEIYAEGARRHGWPNRLSNADGQPGFGYHRMAVNTACPCDVRLNRRQGILDRAFGGPISPPQPEPPKPEPEELDMALVASNFYFNGQNHIFSGSKWHGSVWHKWSHDGVKWNDECLLAPNPPAGDRAVATGKKIVEITVPDQTTIDKTNMAVVTMLDEDGMVWICRQKEGETSWDRRKMPA